MALLRIAVIGAGNIAQRYHLPSLKRLAESADAPIQRAALCDLDTDRAREMAARYGFQRAFSDYRAMLDAVAPDAVWVLTPFTITREVAGYTLERGAATFMEKPPGANSRETRELLQIAQRRGTPHQVAFNRRYAPLLQRAKALAAEAGPMQALSCQFYRVRRDEDYFAFGTGLHGLDALRYLADSEVVEAQARPGPRGSALITLACASGTLATMEMLPQVGIQSERYTLHAADRTVMVEGVIGWLTLFPGFLECYDQGRLALRVDNAADLQPAEIVSGFYGESAAFIENLRQGRAPAPDLADALRSVEIAEAVQRAIDHA